VAFAGLGADLNTVSGSENGLALQPDGKAVVAGEIDHIDPANPFIFTSTFVMVRFTVTGQVDPSFGNLGAYGLYPPGGTVTTSFNNADSAAAVTILRDGKIVVVGHTTDPEGFEDFAIAEYDRDGFLIGGAGDPSSNPAAQGQVLVAPMAASVGAVAPAAPAQGTAAKPSAAQVLPPVPNPIPRRLVFAIPRARHAAPLSINTLWPIARVHPSLH
jgi:hypothetical protein